MTKITLKKNPKNNVLFKKISKKYPHLSNKTLEKNKLEISYQKEDYNLCKMKMKISTLKN